jgi:glutamate racemase
MRGKAIDENDIAREIVPCFVRRAENGARTDMIVLACTHYPLLQEYFERLASWPVEWIDPAPAIARRVDAVLSERYELRPSTTEPKGRAIFTSGRRPPTALEKALLKMGLTALDCAAMPLAFA